MESPTKKLIDTAILKSKEALDDARYLMEDKRYSATQNRIYYAIFYSVIALGYLNGFSASKPAQMLTWFSKKFIYPEKVLDYELYTIYKTAYETRIINDYEVSFQQDKEKLSKNYEDAKKFVKIIEEHIESNS